ncbi:peptide-methionine (R)-S-oxide reductase MsrB [Peptostreptococcus faecalis]|uniref:peptide-methionine (R)-S-oxide reductase MsrB n=1 Tax=Peptostreptococcus faecalis TaxID=2045015 RepID=UPI000C7B068C|nr:peptide-methionine (R)-S-oxide reductase MsrB [Peptostreptococcus faecalis]
MNKLATFAGGCFWCMVKPYTAYSGVKNVVSGYTGGQTENPTYKEVCTGNTGHYEAIQIEYDENEITYEELLDIYWKQIDPTDAYGQFADRGEQYRTAIFCHDEQQKVQALESKRKIEKEKFQGKEIATQILDAGIFYPAEENHQNYYKKMRDHYNVYYKNSGRYGFIKSHWDRQNVNREEVKEKLSSIQFEVTQNDMTEVPFENEYYNNFEKGIYVDVVSGEPLFSSTDKFNSGCGWPAFTKPIKETALIYRSDFVYGMDRTEVRSHESNSHLGHVFDDGPEETGGNRYCINSASLKFIPYDKMEECGYGQYKKYVE